MSVWLVNVFADGMGLVFSAFSIGILFLFIFRYFGQWCRIPLEFDLMHHIHSMVVKQNDVSQSRLAVFASVIKHEITASTAQEILFTTHSFGSVYATAALAMALRQTPDLLKGRKLKLIAIGSNLPHAGLMSKGDWLRQDLELVLANSEIQWIEIYAADDPICFYKYGPDRLIEAAPANPLISKRVRFSKMLGLKKYRRLQGQFSRLHRQLVMANEEPYFFDLYLILFGPRNVPDVLQRDPVTSV